MSKRAKLKAKLNHRVFGKDGTDAYRRFRNAEASGNSVAAGAAAATMANIRTSVLLKETRAKEALENDRKKKDEDVPVVKKGKVSKGSQSRQTDHPVVVPEA